MARHLVGSSCPILFLDHAPALGGAERSLLLLLKHLDRRRWQPHLACTGGPLAERAAALNVSVHIVPLPRLRRSPRLSVDWLTGARAIVRLAREIKAVLLHANTVRAALYAAPAARLAGIPFVWHMRDFWLSEERPRWPWADRLGKHLLCGAAARVIANSHAVAAHLPCRDRVTVVHNGIEVARFDPALDGAPFRREHSIPLDAPVVGTVGRLRPWKGQDRFLRAMARVAEAMPAAWFLIVGGAVFGVDDDYPQQLRRLAMDLGLADRVVFTGHLEDVRPALAAMEIFVHAGDPEPFGLVNLEAMAMAKPVVAFAHGALPEIVNDGTTGILVPPEDEAALARAVVALIKEPTRRHTMGQAGRRRARAHFDARRTANMVENMWVHVLQNLRSRPETMT
ncbi:MAG: glycosyltransferase family 4 protein [Ardenticatenia bacterium]|nr:glycosyltransferase family 4 protein [Ardenticatenia bacterium]